MPWFTYASASAFQYPALFQPCLVRRFVQDQAVGKQVGAKCFAILFPGAHPLAVTPAI